ncbi:helicase C-terminal domain-containing protein [Aggregatibacter actinomycetemcomitans]
MAENIREDAKSCALLTALSTAFDKLKELGAAQKAIIFTESKRTQDYLLECLTQTLCR